MPRMSAPGDVTSVSLSMPSGPVLVEGPDADVDDDVAAELESLGWKAKKGAAAKKPAKAKAEEPDGDDTAPAAPSE